MVIFPCFFLLYFAMSGFNINCLHLFVFFVRYKNARQNFYSSPFFFPSLFFLPPPLPFIPFSSPIFFPTLFSPPLSSPFLFFISSPPPLIFSPPLSLSISLSSPSPLFSLSPPPPSLFLFPLFPPPFFFSPPFPLPPLPLFPPPLLSSFFPFYFPIFPPLSSIFLLLLSPFSPRYSILTHMSPHPFHSPLLKGKTLNICNFCF